MDISEEVYTGLESIILMSGEKAEMRVSPTSTSYKMLLILAKVMTTVYSGGFCSSNWMMPLSNN